MKKIKEFALGFMSCFMIAMIAKQIGEYVPQIGGALFAIFLGIICGNTFLNSPMLDKGTKFSESKLLEFSIILMGLTLNLSDILQVGWQGVGFIFIQMLLTIILCFYIGRKFHFSKKFSLLMCAGNAVCGSSAIASVSPILDVDAKDKGISITIVNLTGTILMVVLPILATMVFQQQVLESGALIGGTLQSVGQVIASAKLVSEPVMEMATIFKIIRILFLVIVALGFSRVNTNEEEPLFKKQTHRAQVKTKVPYFIVGFFCFSILNSVITIPSDISSASKFVSNNFEIIALAAIGMRVKFKDIVKEGPTAMVYGCSVGLCQVIVAFCLISFIFH